MALRRLGGRRGVLGRIPASIAGPHKSVAHFATAPRVAEEEKNDGQGAGKKSETLKRLLGLAVPESRLIGASVGSLAVTSSISLVFPAAIGQILDLSLVSDAGQAVSPMYVAGGLTGLFVVQGGFIIARSAMLSVAGERLIARLRKQIFRSILAQDTSFFDKTNTGELQSRLASDTLLVQKSVTDNVVNGLRNVFMAVGGTGMLLYTSPALALVSLSVIPPVFLGARVFGRHIKKRQSGVQTALAKTASVAEEVIANIRTVRQFAAEPIEAAKYDARIDTAYRRAAMVGLSSAWFNGSVHFASNLSLIAVLGYGGSLVMDNEISVGSLTSFLMYSLYVGFNISSLSTVYSDLMRGVGASTRVFDIIDQKPTIPSSMTSAESHTAGASMNPSQLPPSVLAQIEQENASTDQGLSQPFGARLFGLSGGAGESTAYNPPFGTQVVARSGFNDLADQVSDKLSTGTVRGLIELENVSFHYPTRSEAPILNDLNMRVEAGSSVAVVGPSGSGKSTILRLITRLYDPDAGLVKLDGADVKTIDPHWLRGQIGVVEQEPALFSGTIEENIRYGAHGTNASSEQVIEAAKKANAHDFVMGFPDGYDTLVGEKGQTLSGGQRQRIALARCLLSEPKIILLDEATSSLDSRSERLVQDVLERIMVGEGRESVTSIIVSHRISTVTRCDCIVVIDGGQIVQQGTHKELLEDKDGIYATLVSHQLLKS